MNLSWLYDLKYITYLDLSFSCCKIEIAEVSISSLRNSPYLKLLGRFNEKMH